MEKNAFLSRFYQSAGGKQEQDYPLPQPGKPASVLMPLIERNNQLSLLFTVRAAHLRTHAGQISFPGGKQEPQDADLQATALRESHEEIGLDPQAVAIIGKLPDYRTISRFSVRPYLGLIAQPPSLALDHNEVASCFEVPLAFLLDPRNHQYQLVERNGQQMPIYFIHWQDKQIWGATAAFIRNLSNLLVPVVDP